MSQLKDRFRREREEHRRIDAEVSSEAMRSTDEEAALVQSILKEISNQYRDEIAGAELVIPESLKQKIRKTINTICEQMSVSYEEQRRIERLAMANITGLGPITPYMEDPEVTEIVVQRWNNIVIERKGKIEHVDAAFMNEDHLRNIIGRIVQPVGRSINIQSPMVDARLSDGSRVNATIPPVTPDGATLTIRKFSRDALSGTDYINLGTLTPIMLAFLSRCVEGRISMIISGGTNTGKTTMLNMLSGYIPHDELIVTVEDSCELNLRQPNVRRMETRGTSQIGQGESIHAVTIQDLVRNALRMRPDRLIVGEIRDHTIVDMMTAMSTGHEGSMSTVHANSPYNLVTSRMPILYGMNTRMTFSETAQAIQITEALQLIVQLEHLKNGRRVVSNITHVVGMDDRDRIILKDIFIYNKAENRHEATGYVPEKILEKLKDKGIRMSESIFTPEGGQTGA